jgi:hypothetical protein
MPFYTRLIKARKELLGNYPAIGKDAGYYHKECSNVLWNEERQPYGYAGVRRLFEALAEDVDHGERF